MCFLNISILVELLINYLCDSLSFSPLSGVGKGKGAREIITGAQLPRKPATRIIKFTFFVLQN